MLLAAGEPAGELVYRDRGGGVIALLHTEVDTHLRRRGLGAALAVMGALDDARRPRAPRRSVLPVRGGSSSRGAIPNTADLVVDDPARRS